MKIKTNHFDLKQNALSGQCFRWKEIDTEEGYDVTYAVPSFGNLLIISQKENEFDLSCSEEEYNQIWKKYFDFDLDYSLIEKKIMTSKDDHLKKCFEYGHGVRILKQDLWEMIFSFMISQNNNIKRITSSIDKICSFCELDFNNSKDRLINKYASKYSIFRFPLFNEIPLSIFDDASYGLGYRAPYLKEICEYVSNNPNWLDELTYMNYEDAMNSLMERKGIGKKVANCICLFGLHHTDAFPIDTHVKQLLDKYYVGGFDFERYKGVAGIIQQYLFYYELK